MTTIFIKTDHDRQRLIARLSAMPLPFTANLTKGVSRSAEQNALQRKWLLEAQEQGDQTAEEYRGFCKLHFGVPIMRAESEEFRDVYDRLIRPRSYEEKLELMMVPMDLPVTRIMTTKQKTAYLDQVYKHFSEIGICLTVPGQ